ncbi:hypothetical protein NH340_JMT07276 [Sarcoptes scabiei]|nr:hypothetical protein NH340_JMT07276 [Sarcoptes scabiei]
MSSMFCTGCGECFELGAFTDEVQYREDARGRYMAVGTTYNVEKGFVNSKFANHVQFMTSVENARTILKRYCDKLFIAELFAKISCGFYHQLLIKKFMNGRRLNVVLAACLYIAVRNEGANVILLDISDVSEANVYDIGRYYFQIMRLLHLNIQTVDPSEYIVRFVEMLNLGDRNLTQVKRTAMMIRDTGNRLVQRMKRDWIHYGRRPSGVCAAAVLVAARINNVHCSIKDIISIAKVCESTIRKRINEFIETPSSQLTYKEFMEQDLDVEEDPPSYKLSNTLKDAVEANLEKAGRYQEIIEEHLKDSRAKLRNVYSKFLRDILTATDDDHEIKADDQSESENENDRIRSKANIDDESSIIEETILNENLQAVEDKLINNSSTLKDSKYQSFNEGNPSADEIRYWSQFRPTTQSLGLLKRTTKDDLSGSNSNQIRNDYEDLLNDNLDEIDDAEVDAYLISDQEEINQRQLEWRILNKSYLDKIKKDSSETSESRTTLSSTTTKPDLDEIKSMDTDSSSSQSNAINVKPSKRIKRKKINSTSFGNEIEAQSTSEAVEAACKRKLISLNHIDLKKLFNEESPSLTESSSCHLRQNERNKSTTISKNDNDLDDSIRNETLDFNKNGDQNELFNNEDDDYCEDDYFKDDELENDQDGEANAHLVSVYHSYAMRKIDSNDERDHSQDDIDTRHDVEEIDYDIEHEDVDI